MLVPFDEATRAVITQATENLPENGADRVVILDIDVSTTGELAPDSDALWATFERLRDIKNTCFFSSLEKSTWEAYQ
ncbi:hypothetical protein [Chondromyces apiculatus]|uniref:hypothetical protein n=1 Tax=Chondromyces apiculatus TaxID=51 RepID=UPI001E30BF9B|nr:hypothetical protein [Chondromyces apiculatus]